ncbi:DUF924 family protein [Rivibacter subsaxonicus]|uniref:Uncharacterized protein (DUF924 family) n=1 Tax=Rivibacter subsaxonicus TaxID=457575 RepID=A0A4Q7VZ60_9BURK|nr:DUF924 family protein [Rivibacter subsaxonicus]RZU02124.1 uncharacterized protein (DUF924 family) [Rivibacter subsaxonicus]
MQTDETADTVLDFWFGPEPGVRRAEWFRKDPAFDALIAERFGALVETALAHGLDHWAGVPRAALARLIVLDQFTRNIHRGSARAFAGDALALAAARELVRSGWDRGYTGVQRGFVYLPFEHAEDLAAQREALRLFGQLERDDPTQRGLLEWAQKHFEVIACFGRFPHRNEALGRASTVEEQVFLAQPGSGF